MSEGKENCYVCQQCQGIIRTVDVDVGVTPMLLTCANYGRGKKDCNGMMQSYFYREDLFPTAHPNWPSNITHEWYKPSMEEITAMPRPYQSHYLRGGLKIRERKNE